MRLAATFLCLHLAACGFEADDNVSPLSVPDEPYAFGEISLAKEANGWAGCELNRLDYCANSNALVNQASFAEGLAEFLGDRRRAYTHHPDGQEGPDRDASLVSGTLIEVSQVPEESGTLGRYLFFAGCRPHSCSEKGFVVLQPDGDIVAIGILHFWNELGEKSERKCCGRNPDLDIYFSKIEDWDRVEPSLIEWAKSKASDLYRSEGEAKSSLRKINRWEVEETPPPPST